MHLNMCMHTDGYTTNQVIYIYTTIILFPFRDKYTHFYICMEKSSENVHYTLNTNILYYIIILLHISRYTYVPIYRTLCTHMYERVYMYARAGALG